MSECKMYAHAQVTGAEGDPGAALHLGKGVWPKATLPLPTWPASWVAAFVWAVELLGCYLGHQSFQVTPQPVSRGAGGRTVAWRG